MVLDYLDEIPAVTVPRLSKQGLRKEIERRVIKSSSEL
jgi:hypothetical protein